MVGFGGTGWGGTGSGGTGQRGIGWGGTGFGGVGFGRGKDSTAKGDDGRGFGDSAADSTLAYQ